MISGRRRPPHQEADDLDGLSAAERGVLVGSSRPRLECDGVMLCAPRRQPAPDANLGPQHDVRRPLDGIRRAAPSRLVHE
jgi:hypothetical protein